MNLELIKKYEKEFLHMLHGGTLLSRVMTSDEDDEMYTIWCEVNACNDMNIWASDYLFTLSDRECKYYKPQFIINDEYVEFRKAKAEGKTIEELYYTPIEHLGTHLSGFAISPKMLRIKQEEHIKDKK